MRQAKSPAELPNLSIEQTCTGCPQADVGLGRDRAVVEAIRGEAWGQFRDRRQDWGRDLALWLTRRQAGMKLKELGEKAAGLDYTTAGFAIQRIELGRQQDPALQNAIARAEEHLRIQRCDP